MNNETTKEITSSLSAEHKARGDSVKTNVTFNWQNVTVEELQELATSQAVIMAQSRWRKDGSIPSGDHTVTMRELLDAERAPRKSATVESLFDRMDPAQKKAWLAEQMAKMGM